ncbi:hypothetical protein DY000_02059547 [Brassica cretica]|uniref:Uncharacterized protein n=1 Tax=Brassica cretica TaxID=69181 RepID=A0ABQ7AX82_BRACR|nr:hypothetical protein DY000_02059547 [Brassica cretica]
MDNHIKNNVGWRRVLFPFDLVYARFVSTQEVSEWALLLGACKFRPDLGACRSGEVGGGACCFSSVLRDVSSMSCSSPLFVAHPLCFSSGLGDPCLLLEWFVAQNHCRIRVSCSRLFKFCPFASSRVQAGLCLCSGGLLGKSGSGGCALPACSRSRLCFIRPSQFSVALGMVSGFKKRLFHGYAPTGWVLPDFPVKEMDLFGDGGKPQRCDLSLKLGISGLEDSQMTSQEVF